MTTLLIFAFISGFLTILAPCIWPLLPIVFSATAGGGKQRPLGISLGIISSFAILTLFISYIESLFHIDPNVFRNIGVVIILALGIVLIFPGLLARFEIFINKLLGPLQTRNANQKNGFGPGYVTGLSIGMVWAPCAGPILATIATLAATQAVTAKVVLITLAYVGGLAIPLFLFASTGSLFFNRMKRLNKYTGRIQQAFGVVIIITAILIYTNYDKTIQAKILDAFPGYSNFLSQLEDTEKIDAALSSLRDDTPMNHTTQQAASGTLPNLGPATDVIGGSNWLNTDEPLNLEKLKGKVVLVDFWTYSCINCVRTLPYITKWYDTYKDQGLVVIGVHTPEFAFEKNTANVRRALVQHKIHYPVVQDNEYNIWQGYNNHYWPAEYLIDAAGNLRRTHFGEGGYLETEQAIRELLGEAGHALRNATVSGTDTTPQHHQTPETYLGIGRLQRFSSLEKPHPGAQQFSLPSQLSLHHFAYGGKWILEKQYAESGNNASLKLHFQAAKVFLVISPSMEKSTIRVFLDGRPITAEESGADVKNGLLITDTERLYHLVDLNTHEGSHTLRLEFPEAGIKIFAFTFG